MPTLESMTDAAADARTLVVFALAHAPRRFRARLEAAGRYGSTAAAHEAFLAVPGLRG